MSGARKYRFVPAMWDITDPRPHHPPSGTVVQKTSGGPGAPKNGTMGHSFIKNAQTGEFHGLVADASLRPVSNEDQTAPSKFNDRRR